MGVVSKGNFGSIISADNYNVGDVGGTGGAMTIHLVSASFNGTVSITARAKGETAFVAIPYTSLHLNGSAGTGALVTTAITTTSLVQIVVADGMDIGINCTAYTSGALTYRAIAGGMAGS
jgi:hypothetical protein